MKNRVRFLRILSIILPLSFTQRISDAVALAVVLDLRPLGFTEKKEGIVALAEAVFKAGQSIPYGVPINRELYLPSRSAGKASLQIIRENAWRF